MKAVQLIREEGLKNRMLEPGTFISQINRLSIQMTNTRRKRREALAQKGIPVNEEADRQSCPACRVA